jgi:hypothetical protein
LYGGTRRNLRARPKILKIIGFKVLKHSFTDKTKFSLKIFIKNFTRKASDNKWQKEKAQQNDGRFWREQKS